MQDVHFNELHTYNKKELLSVDFKNEKWASDNDDLFINITQLILNSDETFDVWDTFILRSINTYSTSLSTPLERADNADDTNFLLKELKDMKFAQLSETYFFAHNQRKSYNQKKSFNQRESIDILNDISLQNVTHHCWVKVSAFTESTYQSVCITEFSKSNKYLNKYYSQLNKQEYLKINDKNDYVTANKSASTASALTVNITTSIEYFIVISKSHTYIITVFIMLTVDTDNADTDESLILKQVMTLSHWHEFKKAM